MNYCMNNLDSGSWNWATTVKNISLHFSFTYSSFSSAGRIVRRFIMSLTSRSLANICANGVTIMSSNPFLRIKLLIINFLNKNKPFRRHVELEAQTVAQCISLTWPTWALLFGPPRLQNQRSKSNSKNCRYPYWQYHHRKTCAFYLFDYFICFIVCLSVCLFLPKPHRTEKI